jgi:hypothetical protein
MPQYLRRLTVRLLEASMECLALALLGLAVPARRDSREDASKYAAPIGLIGTAAEQAMAAILVHVFGEDALQASNTQYKSARQILEELRELLHSPVPRASFLTAGLEDPPAHLTELAAATSGFPIILVERAAGLHAGSGPTREAAYIAAKRVHDFLASLAKSTRIRPYLEDLPRLPVPVLQPNVLIDELASKLAQAEGAVAQAGALRSLFLILPEIPDNAPEWLGAIERVTIAPTETDLILLVTALQSAIPVQLQRASAKGAGISVVVRPDDPNAVPIAAHHLRRSFTQIADQWHADVGNANGRLESGRLDLPPDDFVLDLFVLGSAELKKVLSKDVFTPHEVWPFVASALVRQGTPGPFWFLVRLTDDYGQLEAMVKRAFAASKGANLAPRQRELADGLEVLRKSTSVQKTSGLVREVRQLLDAAATARARLVQALERNRSKQKAFPEQGEQLIREVADNTSTVGEAIEFLLKAECADPAKRYWARMLCESASDPLDRRPLVSVLRETSLDGAHTAARKAIRLIDTMDNGPQMHVEGA